MIGEEPSDSLLFRDQLDRIQKLTILNTAAFIDKDVPQENPLLQASLHW